MILIDGALGTRLQARGIPSPAPAWSAWAVAHAPEDVAEVHRSYAEAGATVHTAATFRTTPRGWGTGWEDLARRAVDLARGAVPADHRVAGSMAPLEDCYRPDLSPPRPGPEHRAHAEVLALAGVDLLLCETFAHPGEALAAVEAALGTGLPTWLALTAGHRGDLLSPRDLATTAQEAARLGAEAVLVNCVPAEQAHRWLEGLVDLGVPFGAYANVGGAAARGEGGEAAVSPARYAELAAGWTAMGARLVGACCGSGPAHIRALQARLRPG